MNREALGNNTGKRELRARYHKLRRSLDPAEKSALDDAILNRILGLDEYRRCGTLLCYVSTAGEVDTRILISRALESEKRVAVPRCVPGSFGVMEFYEIAGLDELVENGYGIPEPDPLLSGKAPLSDFFGALCVTPGLAYDRDGFRLGYGGGYYDRFLAGSFSCRGAVSIGVCYEAFVAAKLPRGEYDRPCDLLVSETEIRRFDDASLTPQPFGSESAQKSGSP